MHRDNVPQRIFINLKVIRIPMGPIIIKHIILDTNMLMAITQCHVDIFSELRRVCDFPYDISVLDKTLSELGRITKAASGADKRAANIATSLIKNAKDITLLVTPSAISADDALTELSHKGYIIVTQDAALKKRLKRPYITLRKKQHLIIG